MWFAVKYRGTERERETILGANNDAQSFAKTWREPKSLARKISKCFSAYFRFVCVCVWFLLHDRDFHICRLISYITWLRGDDKFLLTYMYQLAARPAEAKQFHRISHILLSHVICNSFICFDLRKLSSPVVPSLSFSSLFFFLSSLSLFLFLSPLLYLMFCPRFMFMFMFIILIWCMSTRPTVFVLFRRDLQYFYPFSKINSSTLSAMWTLCFNIKQTHYI